MSNLKKLSWVVIFSVVMVGFGCSTRKTAPVQPEVSTPIIKVVQPGPKQYKSGDLDDQGQLVLYVVDLVPLVLKDDFGVMLVNSGGEKKPEALYILGIRNEKRVLATRDPAEFAAALRKIPSGRRVQRYDKCSAFLSDGLSERDLKAFERSVRKFGIADSDGWDITCTCRDGER